MFVAGICFVSTATLLPPGRLDFVRLQPSPNECCRSPDSKASCSLKTALNILSYATTFNDNSWRTSRLCVMYRIMGNKACVLVTTCWRMKNLLHADSEFSTARFLNVRFGALTEVLKKTCCWRIRSCGMWRRLYLYVGTKILKEVAASRFEM
jgi:hypothetical protein